MKSFKTESKRVLDLMINSIYTNKEIFIRELLSNCSDALDKLYYKSLTGGITGLNRSDFQIKVQIDKENRLLTITDNGIGMSETELDKNLGTIAKSGSLDFKQSNESKEDINIIGQFGVGFYSAFMVSQKVEVISRAFGEEEAHIWISSGTEGYTIKPAEMESNGTQIILHLKPKTEEEDYDRYLDEYEIKELIKKYSDYIRYPIMMLEEHHDHECDCGKEDCDCQSEQSDCEKEDCDCKEHSHWQTVNTMVPLWEKDKSEITKEQYNACYSDLFYDGAEPLRVIHTNAEGNISYKALLFIPQRAPMNYYSKSYEKGLRLYSNGVLITEKCEQLLPDYYSFVKGLVDSELTLNISRETIQHNRQIKQLATNLERKIKKELLSMLESDRESYEKFWKAFGLQIKYGLYSDWGAHKEELQDLVMFTSIKEDKLITLKEYADKMLEEQKYIYFASGKSVEGIKALPQCEKLVDLGYDILCFTEDVDEFAVKMLEKFNEKEFRSVASSDLGIQEEEMSEADKELAEFIKQNLDGRVEKVKVSTTLKTHPVCLGTEGDLSIEMEKVLNAMPNVDNPIKAQKVLEINKNHSIYGKLIQLFDNDKDKLKEYSTVLLSLAELIEGLAVKSPTELADTICNLLS